MINEYKPAANPDKCKWEKSVRVLAVRKAMQNHSRVQRNSSSHESFFVIASLAAVAFVFAASGGRAWGADCNSNGIDDAADISEGTSLDCAGNGVPDECEAIVFVDYSASTGLNDGSSWGNAHVNLQDALSDASANCSVKEVWVAAGTYKPDQGGGNSTGDRFASFNLPNAIALLGGFNGTESHKSKRDFNLNKTVLSGDLSNDDEPVECIQDSPDCDSFGGICDDGFCITEDGNSENSYHVVTSEGPAGGTILDGFAIVSGNANSISGITEDRGGGITIRGSNPTITNCTFQKNSARRGGAIDTTRSNPLITECFFKGNVATLDNGGGINNRSVSSPFVANCMFVKNVANSNGGGVGSSTYFSGEIGQPVILNCRFIKNRAFRGGGVSSDIDEMTIANCEFNRNQGGVGGGIYIQYSSDITNCTFLGNSAISGGGLESDYSPRLKNCILWGNTPEHIGTNNGNPRVDYSIVQGGWTGAGGTGVVSDNPLFLDVNGADNVVGTEDDDLSVMSGSPAIDSGINQPVPAINTIDLAGNPRFWDDLTTIDTGLGSAPIVDMGVYEYFPDCNENHSDDFIDMTEGTSEDCNGNAVPDECEREDACPFPCHFVVLDSDFEAYSNGANPDSWFDTVASTSNIENDSLFRVFQVGEDLVFGTTSTQTNIHSHFVGSDSESSSTVEYSGRLRIASDDGGIGVTFNSGFNNQPNSTYEYLRIRRANYAPSARTFHLAPPNFDSLTGDLDSGVDPSPNTWYRFRIMVDTTAPPMRIQANFWEDGLSEPSGFQIDAVDPSGLHPTFGTVGVWSMADGGKYWDDIKVVGGVANECDDGNACTYDDTWVDGNCSGTPIDCSALDDACNVGVCIPDCGFCVVMPANEGGMCEMPLDCVTNGVCLEGACTGAPTDCSNLNDACVVGTCNSETGECEISPANEGGTCDDLNVCTFDDACIGGVCVGKGLDCSQMDNACLVAICNEATGLCEPPAEAGDCNSNGVPDTCESSSLQTTKLTANDAESNNNFGNSVVIDGTTAVIGSHTDDDDGTSSGSAYVFREIGGAWQQISKLTANDASEGDRFGKSVALDGDTAIVGAYLSNVGSTEKGAAYVFREIDGVWQQIAKLVANDGSEDDRFGWSVSLSGNTAIVGAYRSDSGGLDSGAAYVFSENGGSWQQIAKITSSDREAGDYFGWSVSISGGTAIVGAFADSDGGPDSGSSYLFRENNGIWQQISKLTASDASQNDRFGYGVGLSGDTAVVGAYQNDAEAVDSGAAYVFREIDGEWQEVVKLVADDASSDAEVGRTVAIDGETVILGAHFEGVGIQPSGSAYVFREIGAEWRQIAKLTADDATQGYLFARSVAMDGRIAIAGAQGNTGGPVASGSSYVFFLPAFDCNTNGVPDECDITEGLSRDCNKNGLPDDCEVLQQTGIAHLIDCLGGPESAPLPANVECAALCLQALDTDSDDDVDLRDYAEFLLTYQ